MRDLYFERDQARGLSQTFNWLVEEVGELARALRKDQGENIREELSDVLAWVCSIANLANVELVEAAFEKYPGVCPRCRKARCSCP